MTHPAFKSFEGSTGFWVGKFETGYLGANSRVTAQVNQEETSKIIIKPNVYSWRSINISNAFTNSQKYQSTLDSHMMKNSEWGAVAYLTNSRFGRCNGVSCEEARINNLTSYITGSASNFEPTCGYTETNEECNHYESISQLGKDGEYSYNYYNSKSTVASTTGNYYGIYDMAGGSWEYVMGVMKGSSTTSLPASGRNKDNNSGFKGLYSSCKENDGTDSNCGSNTDGKNWPDAKYYDLYDYKTINNDYQRGHLGDAAKEFGPFYLVGWPKKDGTYHSRIAGSYNADLASSFVYSDNPWVIRGAACTDGAGAGVGAFGTNHGNASVDYSFRVILTPII